ncbi:MAG: IS1634 family transposase, partial [Campylobacterota bacterium]|nr:IS1634 family transposase [Campylobacterota bacterium]
MFIRVKSTPNSPRKSVQIVHSERIGSKVKQKIIKHVGVALDDKELEELKALAVSIKAELESKNQLPLYSPQEIEDMVGRTIEKKAKESAKTAENKEDEINRADYDVNLLDMLEEDRIIKGIHEIYGKLYDEMSFKTIIPNPNRHVATSKALKEIVLARVANPDSKSGSVNMLSSKFGVNLNLKTVYRMMDMIDDTQVKKLNKLVLTQTKSLLDDKIDVIYFDATTLYFESFTEDVDNPEDADEAIRKNGYSKDGKFNQPQVVLALLVTKQGLPVGYKAFSGDTFDGHTIIPSLKEIEDEFKVDKIVYVADAGMFNKSNLEEFDKNKNMTYIVGAKIKTMSKIYKKQILKTDDFTEINDDTKVKTLDYKGKKLLVSYSKKRAKKDKHDREKAITKLKKRLEDSKSVKSQLSNNGYKKYLQLESSDKNTSCDLSIALNEDKILEDEAWDGLKGIITNNQALSNEELIHQYSNLWQVEESFRITKHDLKIRPIYHWKPSRVKAHLAISFMAYALVRYLEYRVRLQYKKLSPEKIKQILLSVQTSILYDTATNKKF